MTFQLKNIEDTLAVGRVIPARLTSKPGLYQSVFKRIFETTLIILSLPIVAPVIALLALILLCTGERPFYSQQRVGLGGRTFWMWKLRTMIIDADTKLEAYLKADPTARKEWNTTQKLKDDPRITRFGRILRKTSLDELPQLFNVLNGTMALVGPRPMLIEQEDYYYGSAYYYHRPGLTGLWQVSDRNECEFTGRVRFDDAYDRIIGLNTDATIIARTFTVVLRGTGY
jgi:exopolysaccharide production protein ExoY